MFPFKKSATHWCRETCPLQSWFTCNNFGLSAVVFLWPRERQLCVYSCYWWTNWNIKDYKSVISDTKPFLCEIVSDFQCECVVYLLLFPIGALRLHSLDFFSTFTSFRLLVDHPVHCESFGCVGQRSPYRLVWNTSSSLSLNLFFIFVYTHSRAHYLRLKRNSSRKYHKCENIFFFYFIQVDLLVFFKCCYILIVYVIL